MLLVIAQLLMLLSELGISLPAVVLQDSEDARTSDRADLQAMIITPASVVLFDRLIVPISIVSGRGSGR